MVTISKTKKVKEIEPSLKQEIANILQEHSPIKAKQDTVKAGQLRSIRPEIELLEEWYKLALLKIEKETKNKIPKGVKSQTESLYIRKHTTPYTIVLQTRGASKNKLGHFGHNRWVDKNDSNQTIHEISFSTEFFNRTASQIASTVIHEACHNYNHDCDIQDTSKSDRHNVKFKNICDMVGMVCTQSDNHKSRGWAFTELSPELETWVKATFDLDKAEKIFDKVRAISDSEPTKPRQTHTTYTCGCTKVRIATGAKFGTIDNPIMCTLCDNPFINDA